MGGYGNQSDVGTFNNSGLVKPQVLCCKCDVGCLSQLWQPWGFTSVVVRLLGIERGNQGGLTCDVVWLLVPVHCLMMAYESHLLQNWILKFPLKFPLNKALSVFHPLHLNFIYYSLRLRSSPLHFILS